MKKTVLICIISALSIFVNLFAAEKNTTSDESIIAYRNAIEAMDAQDYSKALKYSEDAILYRRQRIEKQIVVLKNSLSAKRVQAAGDHFDAVLAVLEKRGEEETSKIINLYLKKKGKEYFDDSINNLLVYLENSKAYPEAHKLIRDIYKMEGEYQFAEEYYLMALNKAEVLDIPDEKYDILYMLADISRLQKDYNKMEVRLLNILAEDANFRDKALIRSMTETIKSDKKDSMEKFINLYRANSYRSMNAYSQLAHYYHEEGQSDRALQFTALAVITGFSRIDEVLHSRDSSYEYENFSVFLQQASFYDDIIEWGSRNSAWESFNTLAAYTKEYGCLNFSRELLKCIARFTPEKYWQRDAVLQLEKF